MHGNAHNRSKSSTLCLPPHPYTRRASPGKSARWDAQHNTGVGGHENTICADHNFRSTFKIYLIGLSHFFSFQYKQRLKKKDGGGDTSDSEVELSEDDEFDKR